MKLKIHRLHCLVALWSVHSLLVKHPLFISNLGQNTLLTSIWPTLSLEMNGLTLFGLGGGGGAKGPLMRVLPEY